jgi:hypothetical protein
MGFFAILSESETADFEVIHCHLNLWSLGGILKHRNFYWDVGLRLRATGAKELSKFSLALPFGTEDVDIEDLKKLMMDQSILELIFGGPVTIGGTPDGPTIIYDELDPVQIVAIDGASSSRDAKRSVHDFSVWNLTLATQVRPGQEAYMRLRFKIRHHGRAWQWKRSLFAKYGALVDLRVADVRETWNVRDGEALKKKIVPIQNIYLFLIAPTWLQSRQVSPPTKYLRLLEGRAWKPYVGNASDIQMGKLLVYYWKNKDDVVSKDNPFRAFLDLHREYGPSAWRNHFRTLLLVLIPFLVYFTIAPRSQEIYAAISDLIAKTWAWILSVGAIGFIGFMTGWFQWAINQLSQWSWLRKSLLTIEKLVILLKIWVRETWFEGK